jgi:hypothetical protein
LDNINDEYIENLIIKGATTDKQLLVTICSVYKKEYFENTIVGDIFLFLKDYVEKYDSIPSRDIIYNSIKDSEEYFKEVDSLDIDVIKDYDYIFDKTNEYLKDRALKTAILESVEVINKGDASDNGLIQKYIEEAICKDLKIDLGLEYFSTSKLRLKRILTNTTKRIPTYLPTLDEYISGGFPPYTLSIFAARIHGFKSSMLSNLAARQVINGHVVVIITLELSEDSVAQRMDAIYSGLDINKLYVVKDSTLKLVKKLNELNESPNTGKLFIKEFPTGEASVTDIKRYLRELKMRGVQPDIIYVDYINLMKTSIKNAGELYSNVKKIAEELRALSFAFDAPVVSVSQLNREGSNIINLREIDFTHISESMGLPATADFMSIFGSDDESMVYKSELAYKLVKNRLGGRVGSIDKFYFDSRTLKIYDATELDLWLDDANISNDDRDLAPTPERSAGRTPGRRN